MVLYTRYPIVARALGIAVIGLGRVRRASKGILHTRVIFTQIIINNIKII